MTKVASTVRWFVLAFLALAISASCVDTTPDKPLENKATKVNAVSPSPGNADLRAAFIAATQSDADPTYHAIPDASGAARFFHRAQAFEAMVDGAELWLAPSTSAAWGLSLSTAGVGCENAQVALFRGAVDTSGNRVEIARENVREWYVNGPLGLEQGFTINRAPSCKGTKIVTIDIGGNLDPRLVDDDGDGRGEAVAFVDARGVTITRYTDLFANDATDKRLSAWMTIAGRTLALHVDDTAAMYPIQIDPLIWMETGQLNASDGMQGDAFGYAVALSGDTALVGAYNAKVGGNAQGTAYVFTRTAGVWTQQQKLTASDGAPMDNFGGDVALSGDTALVGAARANADEGAAYVFTRTGGVWTQQQKLTASDGQPQLFFGESVALSGNTALVSSSSANMSTQEAVYVFTRNGTLWTEQQKLMASDGGMEDFFGIALALEGNTAIVGASHHDFGPNTDQGAVYVFKNDGVWIETKKLVASDGAQDDHFGDSIAFSVDTLLIQALGHGVGANSNQGAAYAFTLVDNNWTEQQKLIANDGAQDDGFGHFVALLGDVALVAAIGDDVGANNNQGSAYVFTRMNAVWAKEQKLTASNGAAGDFFGALALSNDTVLVGVQNWNPGMMPYRGTVHVFELVSVTVKNNGETCVASAECASGFCVDGVCCNVACGDGSAADCQACSIAAGAAADGTCVPSSTSAICRPAVGACDAAEMCDGTSTICPINQVLSKGTVCRAAVDVCDVDEKCAGDSTVCPEDRFADSETICHPSKSVCDRTETCTGDSAKCPDDMLVSCGGLCTLSPGFGGYCTKDGICMKELGSCGGGSSGPKPKPYCHVARVGSDNTTPAHWVFLACGIVLVLMRRRKAA